MRGKGGATFRGGRWGLLLGASFGGGVLGSPVVVQCRGAASEAVGAAEGGGIGHVAESRTQNAGLGHGGGAFVTPPGGGAQNGSVEKMWRREKCETKGEAPPQRERRPAGSARPGTPPPVAPGSSSLFPRVI